MSIFNLFCLRLLYPPLASLLTASTLYTTFKLLTYLQSHFFFIFSCFSKSILINARLHLSWAHIQHCYNDESHHKLWSQMYRGQTSSLQYYPCPRFPHSLQWLLQNSPLSLPPLRHLQHTLSLKGDWILPFRKSSYHVEIPEPTITLHLWFCICVSTLIMCYSIVCLLWPGHTTRSVPCTGQAQSHLRAFAPAVLCLECACWLLFDIQIFA